MVDRCGVIAGPWQMGKVDQGVFTFWLLHHHFGRPLTYIGYGGAGQQVRDLLHVADLVELVDLQLADPERWDGFVGNVGGGREVQPLAARDDRDLPRADRQRGRRSAPSDEERPGDVPLYISDCSRLFERDRLAARARSPREVLADIHAWVEENEDAVAGVAGLRA